MPINNSSFTLRWIFWKKISGMSPPFIKAFIIQPEPSFICHSSPSCHVVLVKFHQLFGFSPQNFYSYPSPHLDWLFPAPHKFQICHPSNCYLRFTFCMKCILSLWKQSPLFHFHGLFYTLYILALWTNCNIYLCLIRLCFPQTN